MKVIAFVMSKLRNEGYMVAPYYQGAIMVTHWLSLTDYTL